MAIKENDKLEFDNVHRQFDNVYRAIGELKNSSTRDLYEYSRTTNEKFERMEQFEMKRFDELLVLINNRFDDSIRYTDKRIDKSLNQKEIL